MKTEIENYRACSYAVEFRKKFTTFKEAWDNCERGDWMLWIAQKVEVDKRKLTLAKGKCAELVMHLMHDERSRTAVRASIAYGHGEISESELSAAAADAAAAHAAAYAAAAYAAAHAAAAYAAAYDAAAAASAYAAADAAAYDAAAAASAYAAARNEILKKCADICRAILTDEILLKI